MTKQPKPRLALLVYPVSLQETAGDSSFYKLHICRIENHKGNDEPRNCSHSSWGELESTRIFDDMILKLFLRWGDGKFTADWFEFGYDGVSFIDAERMGILAKGFKTLDKARRAFPVEPKSFGQYATMMAHGLGVKEMIRESPGTVRRRGPFSGGFYSDTTWQVLPIASAQSIIDGYIADAKEIVVPTREVVA